MKRGTDIRKLQRLSDPTNAHLLYNLCYGLADGDDDVNGDRMRVNDSRYAYDG